MRLNWNDAERKVMMTYEDDTVQEWFCGLWARQHQRVNDGIFVAYNEYWKTQPLMVRLSLDNIYRDTFNVLNTLDMPVADINLYLQKVAKSIIELYDWDKFRYWVVNNSGIMLLEGKGIKEKLGEKDKPRLTYFTDQYIDLAAFSIICKGFMPIWGVYYDAFRVTVGKGRIDLANANMLQIPEILNLPPMVKLTDYVDHFITEHVGKSSFSIMNSVGDSELPDLLMALALIKKISIYDIHDPEQSIVSNTFHLMIYQCREISKRRPRHKETRDGNDKDLSITDQYKMAQRTAPAIGVMLEKTLQEPLVIAQSIDPTCPMELVEKYNRRTSRSLEINNGYHLPVLAMVCKSIMNIKLLLIIDYPTMLNVIIATAAVLEHRGMLEVSELLTTEPVMRDVTRMSLNTTQRVFQPIKPVVSAQLEQLYTMRMGKKTPGHRGVISIMDEVSKYEWIVSSSNFSHLKTSLATLLLHENLGRGVPEEIKDLWKGN